MHREINQRAREEAVGQGGEVVSPDLKKGAGCGNSTLQKKR